MSLGSNMAARRGRTGLSTVVRWLLLLGLFVGLLGASTPRSVKHQQDRPDTDDDALVASLPSADIITRTHLFGLFESNHLIASYSGGSGWYGVYVAKGDAERAQKLLRDDAARSKYWISISGEARPRTSAGAHWHEKDLSAYGADTAAIGAHLPRSINTAINKHLFRKALRHFGKVQRARWRERPHLGPGGRKHVGYEVEVVFRDLKAKDRVRTLMYQVLSDKTVSFPTLWQFL
jgi:hypothetical protein